MPDKLSLKEILEVFVKLVRELEKCILFPSLLMDIPVTSIGGRVSGIFKEKVCDCREVYHALVLLKNEVIGGFKQQWQDLDASPCPLHFTVAHKLRVLYKGLSNACLVADMLSERYRGAVNEQTTPKMKQSPSRHDSVEDDDFFTIMAAYERKLQEMKEVVLIPAILFDLHDPEIMSFLKRSDFDVIEMASLRDVFSFLLTTREQIFTPRSELKLNHLEQPTWKVLEETYHTFRELFDIVCGLIQRYQVELERSTGEKWNGTLNKLCIAELQLDLGDFQAARTAHIMQRIEQTMEVA